MRFRMWQRIFSCTFNLFMFFGTTCFILHYYYFFSLLKNFNRLTATNVFSFQNMPIFGDPSSPYDEAVEKATSETMTTENWTLMFDICDRVAAEGARACKQCLLSVRKRLNHRDPHVVLMAFSLLDCLWNNCGTNFRREVSSKDFVGELNYKCTNSNRVIAERVRLLVKKWAENECAKDSSLSLVESLYKDLRDQGLSFEPDPTTHKKKPIVSNDPNVVSSEQEEADIAKAIALSLAQKGKQQKFSQNLYPNVAVSTSPSQMPINNATVQNKSQCKKVKALYDFEAAEDNELSFLAGELIIVHDDSDQNWWRGSTERGSGVSGLFPASFVTEEDTENGQNPNVPLTEQNDEGAETMETAVVPKVQIDQNVLLKCIELFERCDPSADSSSDPAELPFLEQMAKAQAPLIDQKLVKIDKQIGMLAEVDIAIREVLTAYDTAVQQVAMPMPFSPSMVPLASSAVHPPVSYATTSVPTVTSSYLPPQWIMNGQWPQQQNQ